MYIIYSEKCLLIYCQCVIIMKAMAKYDRICQLSNL